MSSHDGTVTVTNDGATILKAVHIDNPAAKVLVDIAKTQVRERRRHRRSSRPQKTEHPFLGTFCGATEQGWKGQSTGEVGARG